MALVQVGQCQCSMSMKYSSYAEESTYDHRVWRTGLPVRSAVLKPHAGELVVRWVTTSESSLLHVFSLFLFLFFFCLACLLLLRSFFPGYCNAIKLIYFQRPK